MTNKQTLSLLPDEWRALTLLAMQSLHNAVNAVPTLSDGDAAEAHRLFQRIEQLMEAWRRSCREAGRRAAPNGSAHPDAGPDLFTPPPEPNQPDPVPVVKRRRNKASPPTTN